MYGIIIRCVCYDGRVCCLKILVIELLYQRRALDGGRGAPSE